MAVIGTFGSFTAARLGIYASQSSLNVTGNNIANINTKGYTRQRLDLVSLNSGGNSRYANNYNLDIGYGVIARGTSQLRDPFIDIRYRNEQASVGAFETRVNGLKQLSNFLDEVGDGEGDFGMIEAQFNEVIQQLQNLSRNANDDTMDTNVRSACESLTKLFRDYSQSLDAAKKNQTQQLKSEVKSVNEILTQIRDLSEEIREAGIHGDNALELRDTRNVLIDDLSKYMKIDVRYDMEKIDEFTSVERINISIADSGTPPIKLVQGIYATQISMPDEAEERNPDYDPSLPTSCQYIKEGSDLTKTPPYILYTNNKAEAMLLDGQLVTNDTAGAALAGVALDGANYYDPTLKTSGKYLKKDGAHTDTATDAKKVNNAVEGEDDNRLWMSLEPLKDKKDRLLKEGNGTFSERVDLSDTQLYGTLQTMRELITRAGEFSTEDDVKFDPEAITKRGIPYYEQSLDALARKFAEVMNKANEERFAGYETEIVKINGTDVEVYKTVGSCNLADGGGDAAIIWQKLQDRGLNDVNYLRVKDLSILPEDLREELKIVQERHLKPEGEDGLNHGVAKYVGGNLFSNGGDSDSAGTAGDPADPLITADNISISKSWSTGAVRIVNTRVSDGLDHTTDSDNIEHILSLLDKKFDYKPDEVVANPRDNSVYFTGTFQERFRSMTNVLADDQKHSTIMYDSYTTTSLSIENERQSVSGVDLNEEATSMMMFQKSYSAACQLMTTLDSMLDKLINGTI